MLKFLEEIEETNIELANIEKERTKKILDKFFEFLIKESWNDEDKRFKEIYIKKSTIAKNLGWAVRTLDKYLDIYVAEGYLIKRIGIYNNGKRKIGNSLFITLTPYPNKELKKGENKKKLLDNIYLLYPTLLSIN